LHHKLREKEKKFGGVSNMQDEKHSHGKELICINVDKVYDWIVKEKSFDVSPMKPICFPGIPDTLCDGDLKGATVRCEVTPDKHHPISILGREDCSFCIDGKNVLLQKLNIKKKFDITLFINTHNGGTYASKTIDVSRCEQVTLCAPEGTDVEITYTHLDCFVCNTGMLELCTGETSPTIQFSDLTISVSTCQSIQSTFPVTVEFLADFCEPRDELPTVCPAPHRPKQCSVVFPDDGHGNCCH